MQKAVIDWLSLSAAFRVVNGHGRTVHPVAPMRGNSPFPGAFFQMARHARPLRHVGLPPEGGPGSLSAPSGMPKALRMEGLFAGLRPAGAGLRGADPRGSGHRTGTPDGAEERLAETPAWRPPSRPGDLRAGDGPGFTSYRPASRLSGPKPHRTTNPPPEPRAPSRRPPSSGAPDTPQPVLPADRKPALRITPRLPPRTVSWSPVNARPRQLPCHRDEGARPLPDALQLPGTRQSPDTVCPSCMPAPLPGRMALPASRRTTTAGQRRGPPARPEENFFGDGESTRGEGAVFTKNAPAPLVPPAPAPHCAPRVVGRAYRPPSERAPKTPRAGTVSCPRSPVPAKDGGQFLSALCLRLWPCCMK